MKKLYVTPELIELGNIKDITQQGIFMRSATSGGNGFRGNGLRGIRFDGFTKRNWSCDWGISG